MCINSLVIICDLNIVSVTIYEIAMCHVTLVKLFAFFAACTKARFLW